MDEETLQNFRDEALSEQTEPVFEGIQNIPKSASYYDRKKFAGESDYDQQYFDNAEKHCQLILKKTFDKLKEKHDSLNADDSYSIITPGTLEPVFRGEDVRNTFQHLLKLIRADYELSRKVNGNEQYKTDDPKTRFAIVRGSEEIAFNRIK